MSNFVTCPCCGQALEIVEMGFGTEAYSLPFRMLNTMHISTSLDIWYSQISNAPKEAQLETMKRLGITNGVKINK